ncbi:cyclic nucleotide-binding domain-containing protein [Caenimonas sedimenti]|uniref:Cyclic nucleotide-binding domain-containing protein n=2 Tax=Caenimonas sedimenti TaxID=2596921 RepID=A0A562ZK15_9BURK|nr:cyclic nucleotide-binding domain-containing protein [Caenimonas sedimenti]
MGFGMFAFVALGEAYFGHGVLAGLWSAFIAGVVCVLTGNRSTTVYAPRVTTTFYLGSVLFALSHSPVPALQDGGLPMVLAVFMGIVFLGGAFQALFGLVRLGSLIKFTPYPVMAGFQNAAALLLLLVQASTLLGMPVTTGFMEVPAQLGQAHPLTLVVAAVAVLVMWKGKRWFPRVPALLLGLAAGTLAWYALAAFGFRAALGPLIGGLPAMLRPLDVNALWNLMPGAAHWPLAWVMVPAALGLAFIASLDALLCERIVAPEGNSPRESDRQLVRLGLGNMVAALAGGITAGVNIGPSTLNRAQGARGAASVLVNALVILLTMLFLLPLVGLLPRVALSAVIAVIAIQHFDTWTLQVLRRVRTDAGPRRRGLLLELGVVFVVTLLSVAVNIVAAVFIGVLIAVGLFLLRMSRSVVRRHYRCDEVRSHQSRDALSMNLLARHGARITVFELEGPLFFGSSEALARTVREVAGEDAFAVILDFRRVNDLDSTGARVLLQLHQDLTRAGCSVRFSGLRAGSVVAGAMADLGLAADRRRPTGTPDLDLAIEAAEDDLLATLRPTPAVLQPITFETLELARNFDAREREILRSFFVERRFAAGATVFAQGDFGTELFIVMQGRATAMLHQRGAEPLRLATFAPGATIGELALLDSGSRSATVVADWPLVCLVLSAGSFRDMQAREPAVAIRLLVNLGRELGFRMRRANQMLHRLAA